MTLITKANGVDYGKISKYLGSNSKDNVKTVGPSDNFHNKNAASVSITADGDNDGDQAIYIADSNGDFRFTDDTAMSVSLWVKAGWDASLGTTVYFWTMHNVGEGAYDDMWRMFFTESNNRLYFEWSSGGDANNRRYNFWHFHDNTGTYATAYSASGGPNPWNSAARGNVGNDNYTMITITKGSLNNSLYSNLKLYWNATDCGEGYYKSGSGGGTGTANLLADTDKMVGLGTPTWNFNYSGNNTATKYMGLTMWDKELSSSEVTELYNSGAPLHAGTHSAYAANCVGYYPFQNDGVGEVAGTESFAINGNSTIEAK